MKRTSFLADVEYYNKFNSNYTLKKTIHYKSRVIHLPTKNVVYGIVKNFEKQNPEYYIKTITNVRKLV